MKKLILLFLLQIILLVSYAASPLKSVFIDFGPKDGTNGILTSSPDANGNHWNNYTTYLLSSAETITLKDSQGNIIPDVTLTLFSTFAGMNGKTVSGGALNDPNPALLGDLAIETSTCDWFYTDAQGGIKGGLLFSGLDRSKKYVFKIFGSRNATESRTTQYTLTGTNTFAGTIQISGVDLGGPGLNMNNSTILVSDSIIPNEEGKITLEVTKTVGAYGGLNSLKFEEYPGIANPPLTQTGDTIDADNSNFTYMGRFDFSNPKKPLFAHANTMIKTKFQGTSVSMLLKQYAGNAFSENYFYAIIDNGAPQKMPVQTTKSKYDIASGLTDGTHSLEIIKVTEAACGQCEFMGLIIDDGKSLVSPDQLPSLKLEFYGASTTVGYGIEGGTRPASDDSYKADPAVCARQLNAQLSVVSLSGYGMLVGYGTNASITNIWDKTIPLAYTPTPTNNSWDFTRYVPDVVVITLGGNDYNAPGGINTGGITVEQYITAYKNYLNNLRTKYPDSKFVCTNGTTLSGTAKSTIENAVQTIVNDVKTAGDNKIYYFAFNQMIGGGYNYHPGVQDGINNGTALATFIQNNVLSTTPGQETTTVIANFDDVTPLYDTWGGITKVTETPAENANGNALLLGIPENNSTGAGFWLNCNFTKNQYNTLKFKMKSATNSFQFMLKLESETGATLNDKWFTYTGNGAWQEFSINLTDIEATSKMVIFPAAWKTFPAFSLYFDDMVLTGTTSSNNDILSHNKISLFPNPANKILNILIEDLQESADITLYNIDGKQIFHQITRNSTEQIDLRKLNITGLFLINIRTDNGNNIHKVIVNQN